MPLITRAIQYFRRRVFEWMGFSIPSDYVLHQIDGMKSLGTGYLIIEYITPLHGRMLSDSWEDGHHNDELRTNLFGGLSRILLALARTPLPTIGSFILDNKGFLSLSNRPLTLQIQLLENERIPLGIPRNATHTTADSYIHDILSFHENRLRHQPNAINNLQDGFYQTCALMIMRSVWPCFFRRDLLRGPFFLSLTDLHQSNIFVDEYWNIKCLVDLEWACSRPLEMIHPPHWLGNQSLSTIEEEAYQAAHREFMMVLKEEEDKCIPERQPWVCLHSIMQQGWENGTFWCSLALNTPMALFKVFYDFIQPRFSKTHMDEEAFWLMIMPYWTPGTFKFIDEKLKEREDYDKRLREAFQGVSDPPVCST